MLTFTDLFSRKYPDLSPSFAPGEDVLYSELERRRRDQEAWRILTQPSELIDGGYYCPQCRVFNPEGGCSQPGCPVAKRLH